MTREQQIKIQRCIDEFYSNRPQVRDELGAALQVLYEAEPRWIPIEQDCPEKGKDVLISHYREAFEVPTEGGKPIYNRCPNCGAIMDESAIGQIKSNGRENCPYRHENGNCLPVGGFCLAVADEYCPKAAESTMSQVNEEGESAC